jgi:phospho-N-acetylmuramoyl-pentapeptide-transferase
LKRKGIGKQIRIEQPGSHQLKTGTPTMGGLLFVAPVLVIFGLLNIVNLAMGRRPECHRAKHAASLLLSWLARRAGRRGRLAGGQGIRGRGEGMSPRMKSAFQFAFATFIGLVLYYGPPQWDYVGVPGFVDFFQVGPLIIPITIVVLYLTSNAVNFTDGLDSLAGSASTVAFACYGTIAYMQRSGLSGDLLLHADGRDDGLSLVQRLPGAIDHGRRGQPGVGRDAGAGFDHDRAVAAAASDRPGLRRRSAERDDPGQLFQDHETAVRQGRRIFKMAPLHHHFELLGWSEMQVKERFFYRSRCWQACWAWRWR